MKRRGLLGLLAGAAGATMAVGRAEGGDHPESRDTATLVRPSYPAPPDASGVIYKTGDEHWTPRWTTRAGEMIAVPDLDDSHLLNIERMLRGKGLTVVDPESGSARQWRPIIYEEMVRRGLNPYQWYVPSGDVWDDET